jgi:hypothetical protein
MIYLMQVLLVTEQPQIHNVHVSSLMKLVYTRKKHFHKTLFYFGIPLFFCLIFTSYAKYLKYFKLNSLSLGPKPFHIWHDGAGEILECVIVSVRSCTDAVYQNYLFSVSSCIIEA